MGESAAGELSVEREERRGSEEGLSFSEGLARSSPALSFDFFFRVRKVCGGYEQDTTFLGSGIYKFVGAGVW